MSEVEFLIGGLLVAVVTLSALARILDIPYPIILVLGGAALGFVPGLPRARLDPQVVLVVFLPPLLYGASIYANFTDFRANVRGLTLNSVGLVLATMGVVACIAHTVIAHLSWADAFVLGAIVSPTDPLAATTILRRVGAPRRLVSGIEGEGLFNDATSLVAYRVAVTAVTAASFSLGHAAVTFIVDAAGGLAIGIVVGYLVGEIRRRTTDTQVSVTISLLTGYAAFIPANAIGVSGVLATVAAGIVMGIRGPRLLPARARLQGFFVWDILDFVINALLFVLIGLQLHDVLHGLSGYGAGTIAADALAVAATVTAVRLVWLFTVPYLIRVLDRRPAQHARRVSAAGRFIAGWSGMRGAVSLAVALALPLTTRAGHPYPQRDLIIFLTFTVIFSTLVIQGLSLPALIRRLGITRDPTEDQEKIDARIAAANAALSELDVLAAEDWPRKQTIDRLRQFYEYRSERFQARAGATDDTRYEDQTRAYQRTLQRLLAAQRHALIRLRDDRRLSNEAMNEILRELDLEEARLEI